MRTARKWLCLTMAAAMVGGATNAPPTTTPPSTAAQPPINVTTTPPSTTAQPPINVTPPPNMIWSGLEEDQTPSPPPQPPRRTARAPNSTKPADTRQEDNAQIAKLNAWTVGLAGGQREGAPLESATDISRVVDDGDNLHVLPIVTRGPAENVESPALSQRASMRRSSTAIRCNSSRPKSPTFRSASAISSTCSRPSYKSWRGPRSTRSTICVARRSTSTPKAPPRPTPDP